MFETSSGVLKSFHHRMTRTESAMFLKDPSRVFQDFYNVFPLIFVVIELIVCVVLFHGH